LRIINNINKNKHLIHPSTNKRHFSLSLIEISNGSSEIVMEKEEEVVTKTFNPDGTYTENVTKKTSLFDSIKTHILDKKKFGFAS
jgi:hypothetical protein